MSYEFFLKNLSSSLWSLSSSSPLMIPMIYRRQEVDNSFYPEAESVNYESVTHADFNREFEPSPKKTGAVKHLSVSDRSDHFFFRNFIKPEWFSRTFSYCSSMLSSLFLSPVGYIRVGATRYVLEWKSSTHYGTFSSFTNIWTIPIQ